jgi:hypothetical protein
MPKSLEFRGDSVGRDRRDRDWIVLTQIIGMPSVETQN